MVVIAVFFGLGLSASFSRWVWPVAIISVATVVVRHWMSGAYSDSGNALGFSLLNFLWLAILVLIGAAAGWAIRVSGVLGPRLSITQFPGAGLKDS